MTHCQECIAIHVPGPGFCNQEGQLRLQALAEVPIGSRGPADLGSVPAVNLQEPLVFQECISLIDRHDIYPGVLRQLADSGKAVTLFELPRANPQDNLVSQLLVDRNIAGHI